MSEPIMEFKNNQELNECLKEWKERLFLCNWNIKAQLVHGEYIQGLGGLCEMQWENSCALISIRYANEIPEGIEKEPHEKILVHELLHCKFFGVEQNNATIESVFWDTIQHQLLEQMAKSLIMSKYNIPYEWFLEKGASE